ncbi:receptor-like protein EIX2 [Ziziphus jujuba]|uniref:Receptor-like protein EIX2 n=1 Tax=Ziziphus jujuba TaxID=326968 RepID=A0ABM3I7N1_ZIZJJ|nr:receptor-like protein EIX2 [Ziziphus jujuba]
MRGTGRSIAWCAGLVLSIATIAIFSEGGKSIVQARCIDSERQALLDFKQGLEDYHNTLSSWTSGEGEDCCLWRGVKCDNKTNHVVVLRLGDHVLEPGNFGHDYSRYFHDFDYYVIIEPNKFIGSLTRLRYLNLGSNPISGTIPSQLGNLTRLRFLALDRADELIADNLEWLPRLSSLTTLKLGTLTLSKPADWLQSIKMAPSLSSLELFECYFPYKVATSSLSHINSSNSLRALVIKHSKFHPTAIPWLLNVSYNLVNLTIKHSEIIDPLPNSFDSMRSLENIDLKSNKLEGGIPKSLGNLCNVKSLDLSFNLLNDTLHLIETLTGCTAKSLEILYLQGNELVGSLPDLSQFSSLKELRLADNKLNGSLAESIGQLSNLEILEVSSNYITGVISKAHLQKLSKLKGLDLSFNSLTLNFESKWVPPFQLFSLKLSSCKLGAPFPGWLQTQVKLINIDISKSGISDNIPDWFYNLTPKLINLNLSFNSFKGILPNFPLRYDIYPVIDLSSNQFYGSVPVSLANASALIISNNSITTFKLFLCTEVSDRPTTFLDLSNNMLSESLPDCWMHLGKLRVLNLENNKLSGNIPSSLGSLDQISTLRLSNNSISGILPSSLKNCSLLRLLDVGQNNLYGEIPIWIGDYLTDLIVLHLKSNRFYGSLPLSLCQLSDIQILDLSLNDLFGVIPRCFHNFTPMIHEADDSDYGTFVDGIDSSYIIDPSRGYGRIFVNYAYITWKGKNYKYDKNLRLLRIIDLSSNKLSGEIPTNLTNLVELVQLNLSRNNLSGTIPASIGKMKLLESLDLSHNQLSGKIPMGLADISYLAFLDLSNNQLWGRIPTGTQLQSFAPSQYSENRGLCGPPLNVTCCGDGKLQETSTSCETGAGRNVEEDDEEWVDMSWFYMGIGVGFGIGFLGTCGLAWYFNTSWRRIYFNQLLGRRRWRTSHYGARLRRPL